MEAGHRSGKAVVGNYSLWAIFPRHWVVIAPAVGSDSASGDELSGMW